MELTLTINCKLHPTNADSDCKGCAAHRDMGVDGFLGDAADLKADAAAMGLVMTVRVDGVVV